VDFIMPNELATFLKLGCKGTEFFWKNKNCEKF